MQHTKFLFVICFILTLSFGSEALGFQEKHSNHKKTEASKERQQKEKSERTTASQGISPEEKVLKAKQLLSEAKEGLYYNCCLEDPCDRCALDHQSCSCGKDIRAGKGICSDCYAGWQMGEGKEIPGVTKEKVKPNFHNHKH